MRIVCISDTHTLHKQVTVPDGDMVIHAGDFSGHGTEGELRSFRHWFRSLPHRHKVCIAGNHDWTMDGFAFPWNHRGSTKTQMLRFEKLFEKDGIHYLRDRSVTLEGLKIHGSPWQPEFFNWAFNLPRGLQLAQKWEQIPDDTDILITHGAPYGVMDHNSNDDRTGCEHLRHRLIFLDNLKLHVFGHIHEGYGIVTSPKRIYVNAAICNLRYEPVNAPIVVNIHPDPARLEGQGP